MPNAELQTDMKLCAFLTTTVPLNDTYIDIYAWDYEMDREIEM